jgi:hypothetical protein
MKTQASDPRSTGAVFDNLAEAHAHIRNQIHSIAQQIMKERGLDWPSAWNLAISEHPEFASQWSKFLFQPRHDGSMSIVPPQKLRTESVNELASKERAAGCDRIVKAIQAANDGMSYAEAWEKARAEHRQLFEGEAAVSDKCDVLLRKLDAISERNNNGAVKVVGIRKDL